MSAAEDEAEGLRRTLARTIGAVRVHNDDGTSVDVGGIEIINRIGGGYDPAGIGPLAMARWRRQFLASTSPIALSAGWAAL